MTHFLYFIIIIILLGIIYYLYKENANKIKIKEEETGKQKHEYEKLNEEKTVTSNKLMTYKEKNEVLLKDYKNLEKAYELVKRSNINSGEKIASLQINKILNEFSDENLLKYWYTFDNLMIFDGSEPRQIDHLILCDKGCFVIETKNWKGDVFYNVNKKTLEDNGMGILNRYLNNNDCMTFVLKKDGNGGITYAYNGKPNTQVTTTAYILNQRMKELSGLNIYVNAIVYFNYISKGNEYIFIDGSTDKSNALVANQEDELREVLRSVIKKNKGSSNEISEESAERYLDVLKGYSV